MQTLLVVNLFQKLTDTLSRVSNIAIGRSGCLFLLQRAHESLSSRVVIGIATPTHADLNPALIKNVSVLTGRILNSLIRVMNQALWPPIALLQRHPQRSYR